MKFRFFIILSFENNYFKNYFVDILKPLNLLSYAKNKIDKLKG